MGANAEYVYVGSYTGDKGGDGEGISVLRRDPATGGLTRLGLAARTPSPSFLAQHPRLPVLYAVNELGDGGTVSAFAVDDNHALTPLGVRPTGGDDPAHLAVSPDARHLLVANYTSGSVAVHPLAEDGTPGERTDLLDLVGSGPEPDRQAGPHAHMVRPDRGEWLIADLGSDRVWRCRLDPFSGRLTMLPPAVVAKPGTGPRHLRHSADGALLLVGELSGTLGWYRPGPDGSLVLEGEVAASGAEGVNYPSEIITGRDGRYVYVANRGPDTVSAFRWDGDGAELVAEVPTGGEWPRHMTLLGDHLYVANQLSQSVSSFRVDRQTGVPVSLGEPNAEPSPTCLLRWTPVVAE